MITRHEVCTRDSLLPGCPTRELLYWKLPAIKPVKESEVGPSDIGPSDPSLGLGLPLLSTSSRHACPFLEKLSNAAGENMIRQKRYRMKPNMLPTAGSPSATKRTQIFMILILSASKTAPELA